MLLKNQNSLPQIALSQDEAQQQGSKSLLAAASNLVPIRQQYQLKNANCTRFWQLIHGQSPSTNADAPIA